MGKDVIDFAVVGGGVSGAYCAWRLRQERPEARVTLFEYSDRIGGRLFSRRLPGMPHVWAELGGMRFIPASQPLVTKFIDSLHLCTKDFPMGAPPPVGNRKNYIYLRRTHLLNEEMGDSSKVPYQVDWAERNQSPNDLTDDVVRLLVPNYEQLSFDDWFDVKVFGRYLREYGYWNLLSRVVSPEAVAYMRDGLGYDTNVSNGNAVNLMFTASDTSGSDRYRTLVDGYESLPRALAEEFRDKYGGEEHRNWRLAHLARGGDGLYDLRFVRTKTADYRACDVEPRETAQFRAEHVILAMPRRSLELVEWVGKEAPFLRDNLGAVLIQAAFKLFMGYPYPWWRALDLVAGRSITDLPVRQIFYFGTEGEEPGAEDSSNLNSLLMASYNDISSVPFWKGLERGQRFHGDAGNPHVQHVDPVPASAFVASRSMVEEAHKQVTEVHGQRELPSPYSAIYHDWGEEPYGGGWHSWKAGFKYNEIMPRMRHPIPDEKVYICGSAYSSNQGWVEGALETAELVLTEDIGIDRHSCSKGWTHDPLRDLKHRLALSRGGARGIIGY